MSEFRRIYLRIQVLVGKVMGEFKFLNTMRLEKKFRLNPQK
ncbi:hypothetical protein LEP1GSC051_0362 [Leptospira sp. P2653]|nr:hypothetical protein LEP1GSC051_0362 [Leptospira sp. P2653]